MSLESDVEAASSHERLCAARACRKHPGAGIELCNGHAAKFGQMLADIEGLYATLDAVPSSAVDLNHAHGAVLAAHRSPARMDVLVLRDARSRERDADDPDGNHGRGVLEVLGSWARLVREERNLAAPTTPVTVTTERGLLVAHFDWLVAQPYADEVYRDVQDVHAQLLAAHGAQKANKKVGICPTLVGNAECGGSLLTHEADGSVFCRACERVFLPDELRHLGDMLVKQGYVEVFRAEWFTGVPAGTIRRWVSERRITSEKRGRTLCVNVGEVEQIRDRRRAVTVAI